MADDVRSSSYALANFLEADRAALLSAYERALDEFGSPIVSDPAARCQTLRHADQTLTEIVTSIRTGQVHVDQSYKLLAWDIGSSRAAQRLHPRESLRAAMVLFDVVFTAMLRHLNREELETQQLALAARALHESISVRIREAGSAYTGYLLDKIHQAHIEERRRIARELHDRIGHGLSVAYRQLELFDHYHPTDPGKATARVEIAEHTIRDTMLKLREVTSDLRMDEQVKSLEKALLGFQQGAWTSDTDIRMRINGDEAWASPAIREESFLVIREAVRNALSHSRPQTVLIHVDIAPHELRASVDDDGTGFDATRAELSDGVGLSSMRERAALMGGSLTLSSQAGGGTHVELLVPLPEHRDDSTG